MTRIAITEVSISQGGFEAHRYMGCDGWPTQQCFDVVCVKAADGSEWYLPRGRRVQDEDGFVGYVARYELKPMADRVRACMSIDPSQWVQVEQPEPFEERYAPYGTAWQEEQVERGGWGL